MNPFELATQSAGRRVDADLSQTISRLFDGIVLPPPRRMTPGEMRRGMETRTLHGRRPSKHTYVLAEHRRDSPPLFWRVVLNLDGGLFYPDERIPVLLRMCDVGLIQAIQLANADRLNYRALRNVLYERTWLHPAAPIWWGKRGSPELGFSFDDGD